MNNSRAREMAFQTTTGSTAFCCLFLQPDGILSPLESWMSASLSTTEWGEQGVSLRNPRGWGCQLCWRTLLAMAACRAEVLRMRNTGKAREVASMRPGSSRGGYCPGPAFPGSMEESPGWSQLRRNGRNQVRAWLMPRWGAMNPKKEPCLCQSDMPQSQSMNAVDTASGH